MGAWNKLMIILAVTKYFYFHFQSFLSLSYWTLHTEIGSILYLLEIIFKERKYSFL